MRVRLGLRATRTPLADFFNILLVQVLGVYPAPRVTLVDWRTKSGVEKAQGVVGPFLFENIDVVR